MSKISIDGLYPVSSDTESGSFVVGNTELGIVVSPDDPSIELCCNDGEVRIGDPESHGAEVCLIVSQTTGNVRCSSDLSIGGTNGLILQSPNGTKYRITVSNAGALEVGAV